MDTKSMDNNCVKLMKLGVALAVIRSKPEVVGAKQHAERLSSQYLKSQQNWKKKCDQAQERILNLQQQLCLKQIQGDVPFSGGSLSQDDTGSNSQSVFPTPPPSLEVPSRKTSQSDLALHQDITFLHNILSLNRNASSLAVPPVLDKVTRSTLEHSLKCIKEGLSDPHVLPSTRLLNQAVTNVAEILDREHPEPGILNCQLALMEVFSQVIHRYLNTDKFEQGSSVVHSRLSEMIPCFYRGRSIDILKRVLDVFCDHIENVCSHLRETLQSKNSFSPVLVENSYGLISVMDSCVKGCEQVLSTKDGQSVCESTQERLDTSLIHLTTAYPLIAHRIWRVVNSLELSSLLKNS